MELLIIVLFLLALRKGGIGGLLILGLIIWALG